MEERGEEIFLYVFTDLTFHSVFRTIPLNIYNVQLHCSICENLKQRQIPETFHQSKYTTLQK